jgi:hypothetical protein
LLFHHFRAFDVELLYIAQQLNIPLSEVAVNWIEIDGKIFLSFFLLELHEVERVWVRES